MKSVQNLLSKYLFQNKTSPVCLCCAVSTHPPVKGDAWCLSIVIFPFPCYDIAVLTSVSQQTPPTTWKDFPHWDLCTVLLCEMHSSFRNDTGNTSIRKILIHK